MVDDVGVATTHDQDSKFTEAHIYGPMVSARTQAQSVLQRK